MELEEAIQRRVGLINNTKEHNTRISTSTNCNIMLKYLGMSMVLWKVYILDRQLATAMGVLVRQLKASL